MNRLRGGFSLIEMLIVVSIIAVLAGAGYNYYSDILPTARENTVKANLKIVRDAVSRYFKDNMIYPTSFKMLQGAYLQQSVSEALVTPLQGAGEVWVEVSNVAETNIFQVNPADCIWIKYDFAGTESGGKQMRGIRIRYNGTDMPW
ncbi:MAG TPA: prepilin-type N-terminal cleavage/methylation domain-containing protein [Candidatus Rifleibacterium sp.]|nr:prepilin-type N-terminal cleavage/methylation domain-containing protein [Candidatus Rifleibacterium sp.]